MEPSPVGDGGSAERWRAEAARAFQHYLDRATPHTARRWADTLAAAVVYVLRVYVVTYRLGIYLLNLLNGFLSPMVDPEVEVLEARPRLPTRGSDEFKPFIYRLPMFKFCLLFSALALAGREIFWTLELLEKGKVTPDCTWKGRWGLQLRERFSSRISMLTRNQAVRRKS